MKQIDLVGRDMIAMAVTYQPFVGDKGVRMIVDDTIEEIEKEYWIVKKDSKFGRLLNVADGSASIDLTEFTHLQNQELEFANRRMVALEIENLRLLEANRKLEERGLENWNYDPEEDGWERISSDDFHNPSWCRDGVYTHIKRDGEFFRVIEILPDGSESMTLHFGLWPTAKDAKIILSNVLSDRLIEKKSDKI